MQYEAAVQTAIVNLRTAKIQLLQLLNDRTPVEQFDVSGPFDFADVLKQLDEFRKAALDTRPDLQAAMLTIQQAETTLAGWIGEKVLFPVVRQAQSIANRLQEFGSPVRRKARPREHEIPPQ